MNNLKGFGYRELDLASDLLKLYAKNPTSVELNKIENDICFGFNPDSGNVFLTDDEFNVVMINEDGKLENWLSCGNCGHEDFKSKMQLIDDKCSVCVVN